ncbi:enamine deaminase RidA [Sphingomonas sp. Leaf357]|uniref:RidA family protein n=1 Tax=Sphingomonas sp. Leaf357 TaxID=1736350 RepID=UPI0007023672|nr:RidA family protein [Sphingomonas sp. Leaf357]KQS04949.1 enamine deaminase RidA [Sphingomonas sp. Leaf357]
MSVHEILQPAGWDRPKGYANGIAATGRTVFTAGVIGWDAQENFVATDFAGQFRQILVNTLAILAEGGAAPEHIVRMTWYITDRNDYLASAREVGAIYRELLGRNFPTMAVVIVAGLIEPTAKLEIETTAMVPLP